MLSNLATALYATLALSPLAWAAVSPTSPSGDTVVRVGQPLNALWTVDGTGEWTDVVVQLMTGDNLQMTPLQVLATGIDGTKDSKASWTTPDVTPYSKIYFLQFTKGGDVSTATWTTRFTIAGPDGNTVPPTNTTSAGVQWGIGQLVGSDGQPIPNPTTGNINVVGGAASGSGASAGSVNISASSTAGSGVGSGPNTISVSQSASDAIPTVSNSPSSTSSSSQSTGTNTASSGSGSGTATRNAAAGATSTGAADLGHKAAGRWIAAVVSVIGIALI